MLVSVNISILIATMLSVQHYLLALLRKIVLFQSTLGLEFTDNRICERYSTGIYFHSEARPFVSGVANIMYPISSFQQEDCYD